MISNWFRFVRFLPFFGAVHPLQGGLDSTQQRRQTRRLIVRSGRCHHIQPWRVRKLKSSSSAMRFGNLSSPILQPIPWTTGGRHEGRLRRRAPPSGTSAAACSTGHRIRNPSGTGLADRSSPACRLFTHPSGQGRFAQGGQLPAEMDTQTMNSRSPPRTVGPGFAGNSPPVCPTMPRGITGNGIARLQHSSACVTRGWRRIAW